MDRRFLLKGCAAAAAASTLARPAAASGLSDINTDLIRNLGALDRRKSPGEDEQAAAFDEFVGTWDVAYTNIAKDGSKENVPGQLIVGWILDGRALQDIWIQQSSNPSEPPFKGTTIRFYDPEKKIWRVTWVDPVNRAQLFLEGVRTGNTIDLFADIPKGRIRWSFHDIEPDYFTWRGELSTDNGKSWRLLESHVMRRAAKAAS